MALCAVRVMDVVKRVNFVAPVAVVVTLMKIVAGIYAVADHPNAAMGAHVARANAVPREAVVTKVKVAVLMEYAVQLGIRYVVETKNAALIGLYAVKQAVAPP